MNRVGKHILAGFAGSLFGLWAGEIFVGKQYEKHCEQSEKNADQFADYYALMRHWVYVYQEGRTLADYFKKKGYRKIAVYGLNELGYMVLKELEKSEIEITYCIDRNADNLFTKVDVRRPDEELPVVDAVVVAVVQYYEEVKMVLDQKMNCPILSLEDVVWET